MDGHLFLVCTVFEIIRLNDIQKEIDRGVGLNTFLVDDIFFSKLVRCFSLAS